MKTTKLSTSTVHGKTIVDGVGPSQWFIKNAKVIGKQRPSIINSIMDKIRHGVVWIFGGSRQGRISGWGNSYNDIYILRLRLHSNKNRVIK